MYAQKCDTLTLFMIMCMTDRNSICKPVSFRLRIGKVAQYSTGGECRPATRRTSGADVQNRAYNCSQDATLDATAGEMYG